MFINGCVFLTSDLTMFEKEVLVDPKEYVRIDHKLLRLWITEIFVSLGLRSEDAEVISDVLVTADLMGISSHGVQRVKRYVDGIKVGAVNPKPEIKIVERGATALVDGDNGLGHPTSVKAMALAIAKAESYGIGISLVRRSHHFGIAGYYALKAVDKGFIGVSMTNSEALVSYVNSLGRFLGTNPLAVAVPTPTPPPILFDAATSIVPVGKVEIYAKLGREIPEGWVIDSEGNYLKGNASEVLKAIKNHRASILPLGGLGEEFGGHKGSGLSLVIDIISGVLSGAAWGPHVGYTTVKEANVGHAFIALNIEFFMDKNTFYERISKYIKEIKELKKHPKAYKVWIPGEKSWLTMETRKKLGIPIHKNVLKELIEISKEQHLEIPLSLDL